MPQNVKILLVEDNPDLNHAMSEILGARGYQVTSAENGLEALAILKQSHPDVILCDIMMPGLDGYGVLRHIRADPNLRYLPFIFLTALTSTADQRRAKEIGIDDYLTKPVETQDMIIAINNALRRRQFMEEEIKRQADGLHSRIIALLQHEFRTPLTFVLGYAELLLDSMNDSQTAVIPTAELRPSVEAILDGGKRLQRMIETFLMLADLQNRQVRLDSTDTSYAIELMQDVRHQFLTPLHDAGLTPVLSAENEDAMVAVDADLIRESLRRLLDNTIRYRRPDSKEVWLSIERISVYIGFRVRDEGVGISPEKLKEFARPFEQADRNVRTVPGAGLSLALVRHIAQLHGGKLEIQSEYGKGSTFTLWVPEATKK